MAIKFTSRMGNNGKRYDGVNINNRQFELPGKMVQGTKTKAASLLGVTKAKSVTYNTNHYKNSIAASNVYAGKNRQIKTVKSVVRDTPRKTVIKTTSYGPVNSYGKQTKSINRQVTRK